MTIHINSEIRLTIISFKTNKIFNSLINWKKIPFQFFRTLTLLLNKGNSSIPVFDSHQSIERKQIWITN